MKKMRQIVVKLLVHFECFSKLLLPIVQFSLQKNSTDICPQDCGLFVVRLSCGAGGWVLNYQHALVKRRVHS